MRTFLRYLAILVLCVVVVAAGLLFTPLGARPLTVLFAVGDVEIVDFRTLQLTDKPNQFLVCPNDFCGANPDAVAPVFDLPVEQLRARWGEVMAAQPRLELLEEHDNGSQRDYVQRSARFRFPDIITVQFIAQPPSQSTLAIYSRSIYGASDFGVNRERIDAWLTLLRAEL